jgi:hypothetical protein
MIPVIATLLVVAIVMAFEELERRRRLRGELEHRREREGGR